MHISGLGVFNLMQSDEQCCESGSDRIRNYFLDQDQELFVPDPAKKERADKLNYYL